MTFAAILTIAVLPLAVDATAPTQAAETTIDLWHMQIVADDPGLFVEGLCKLVLNNDQKQLHLRFPPHADRLEVAAFDDLQLSPSLDGIVFTDMSKGEYDIEFRFLIPWHHKQTQIIIQQDYPLDNVVVSVRPPAHKVLAIGLQKVAFDSEAQTFFAKSLPAQLATAVVLDSPRTPLTVTLCRWTVPGTTVIIIFFAGVAWTRTKNHQST